MKLYKKIITGAVTLVACMSLVACNKDIFDFNYTFDCAIVNMNGKTIVLDIDQWTDYEGEQLQLRLTDGSVVLVSSFNTILIQTNGKKDSIVFDLVEADIADSQKTKAEQ